MKINILGVLLTKFMIIFNKLQHVFIVQIKELRSFSDMDYLSISFRIIGAML